MNTSLSESTIGGFNPDPHGGQHGWIRTDDGVRIYVNVRGSGAPLVVMGGMVSGACTDAIIVDRLAERYSVITYDRRGTFRSGGNRELESNIAQQARDLLQVLRGCGMTSANVLATCGAAAIALELLAQYPHVVNKMVVHDPPVVGLLPDAEVQATTLFGYYRLCQEAGPVAAMAAFLSAYELAFPEDFQKATRREGVYAFEKEMIPAYSYQPDIEKLRLSRHLLVMASGKQSLEKGYFYARSARALADRIDCRFVFLPGQHTGYFLEPDAFADAVTDLIDAASLEDAKDRMLESTEE